MSYHSRSTMAVRSNHFSLYQAFKKEVEKLGWTYNSDFVEFDESYITHNCLFFSYEFGGEMKGRPAFSLSNTSLDTYQLESQFEEALEQAKRIITNSCITIELNEVYEAQIDVKNKVVSVGYEVFSFDRIRELVDMMNKAEQRYLKNKTKNQYV